MMNLSLLNELPCTYWFNDSWYDLTNIDEFGSSDYWTSSADSFGNMVSFNFCQKLSSGQSGTDPGAIACEDMDLYATEHTEVTLLRPNAICTPLSTSALDSVTQTSYTGDKPGKSFTDNISIQYTKDSCGLLVILDCQEDVTTPVISKPYKVDSAMNSCNLMVTFSSKDVCPSFTTNALWDFMQQYSYLWGAVFIVMGLFLCIFGLKLFEIAIFIITAFATTFILLLGFYSIFLTDDTQDWVGWTVLVCSTIIGLIVGFIMYRMKKLGAAILAGWGGFMLGLLLNETILYKAQSEVLFWCVAIACAVTFAILAFIFVDIILVISTSFMGAYLFWRGISLYAGGYPNEFELIKQVQSGAAPHVDPWFYAYLGAIVVSFGIGFFIQYKQLKAMQASN